MAPIQSGYRAEQLLAELARADTSKGGHVKSESKRATPMQQSPCAEAMTTNGISRHKIVLTREQGATDAGLSERQRIITKP
jgi:hypothetical protein